MISVFSAATAPDTAIFIVAALVIMAGAFGVVLMRNPVHCALSLVLTLFGVAIAFIAQDAQFLAAVQVIVYAGAIVVLFLFVIMLLGVDRVDTRRSDGLIGQRPLGIVIGLALLGLIVGLAGWSWEAIGTKSYTEPISGDGSNIEKLADSIFTTYLLPFEATSVLLVIAVVGAVVLARKPQDDEPEEITDAISTDDEIAGTPSMENETQTEDVK